MASPPPTGGSPRADKLWGCPSRMGPRVDKYGFDVLPLSPSLWSAGHTRSPVPRAGGRSPKKSPKKMEGSVFLLLMATRRLSTRCRRVPRGWRRAGCNPCGRQRVPPSPGHPLCRTPHTPPHGPEGERVQLGFHICDNFFNSQTIIASTAVN